ncbi:MAG TPA: hypothetical protein VG871_04785 [Vicinamibacterales bacterium]|nr:hypothetical protein [Vicinamibacterales bacterium]
MNWKSTVLVSGASALAAWLGVATETPVSQPAPARTARVERQAASRADIQAEAARLQTRLRTTQDYVAPTRDPFRFGAAPAPPTPRVIAPPPAADVPAPPAPPPFSLAGIGGTETAGAMAYTAVLSTPAGVVLARAGEQAPGGWHVDAVDETSVTVTSADGRTERLSLPK